MGMKFGKLVIVDEAYKTVSEFEEYQEVAFKIGKRFRNTVQCIKDADLVLEINGQYGTAFSSIEDDDNLAHMDRNRRNLDDLNYLIS